MLLLHHARHRDSILDQVVADFNVFSFGRLQRGRGVSHRTGLLLSGEYVFKTQVNQRLTAAFYQLTSLP